MLESVPTLQSRREDLTELVTTMTPNKATSHPLLRALLLERVTVLLLVPEWMLLGAFHLSEAALPVQ